MDFKIRKDVPVPVTTRGFSHGFPWASMAVGDSFVVPQDYWIEDRGMDKGKATAADAMRRIRANFHKWREAAEKPSLNITFNPDHKSGDVEVWLVDRKEGKKAA